MALITISQDDINRNKLVVPAYYVCDIEDVESKNSNDGQSINYWLKGKVVRNFENGSEEFAGVVPFPWIFNSKAPGSMLGLAQAIDPTLEVRAGMRIDTDAFKGKRVAVFIGNKLYEGTMRNDVTNQYRHVA